MNPIIEISLGDWEIVVSAYRLMFIAALVVTVPVALSIARRNGIAQQKFAWVSAGASLGAIAGARLMAVLTTKSPSVDGWSRLVKFAAGDFALYGGLIGGGLVGWGLCVVIRQRPLRMADSIAPAIGAGIAVMRVGCLLSGCCCGKPTHLPWGITYPTGSTPHLRQILSGDSIFASLAGPGALHPFPIYDMASALTGALLAVFVVRHGLREGSGMAVFVLWYSAWRLLLSPLRADPGSSLLPGWFWPGIFLAAVVVSACWLLSNREVLTRKPQLGF